jgi:aminoglycoside phosphotransferase (APT) family kinase protein
MTARLAPRDASLLPDSGVLARGLGVVLHPDSGEAVTLLDRRAHGEASTFPSEVVTCRLRTGERLELLCKYSGDREHGAHGHRGGVEHEARVYRHVLRRTGLSVPRFRGSYEDPSSGWTWLVVDYIEGAETADSPTGVVRAAEWIGSFHAVWDAREGGRGLPLRVYDQAYYRGWARRTLDFVGPQARSLAWLRELCERFGEIAVALLESPTTVVHGEYYPLNVLVSDEGVHPVDWEAAARGPGQIELASLTQSWLPEIVAGCEAAYAAARWPAGPPAGFEEGLEAARLYWLFRWLGEDRRRTAKRLGRRIDKLRSAARVWKVLPGEAS